MEMFQLLILFILYFIKNKREGRILKTNPNM